MEQAEFEKGLAELTTKSFFEECLDDGDMTHAQKVEFVLTMETMCQDALAILRDRS